MDQKLTSTHRFLSRSCAQHAGAMHMLLRVLVAAFAWVMVIACADRSAWAQSAEDLSGASYITPFPGGERYKLRVIGDEFGEGMHDAIAEALGGDPRLDIEKKAAWLSGLTRPDTEEELKRIAEDAARDKPQIAVVMFGSLDRWSYRAPDGRRHSVGSSEWRSVYAKRTDQLIRSLRSAGTAVYWVGLPIMRRGEANEAAQVQNEIFRERAYLSGVRYIDVQQGFAGEQGEYTPYGPDLAGKIRLLRDSDGMHMTGAGYQKLAHFVERELKRDLNQAKNERAIPLAGSEAEQALINPIRHAAKPASGAGAWTASAIGAGSAAGASGAAGDQPAENGHINLKTATNDGREQVLPIEILRPAIPAAVIALVTRRESPDRASQMGDQVTDQIPGGLTVMSSITPGAESTGAGGNRHKVSPAQTPYFRVLVKGERIASRPGRADDTSWPRPQAPEAEPSREIVPNAAQDSVPLPTAKPRR
ncbi:MAG: DUF459 domain-containing protein [Hyphomicrobiaceae bacterium]|nr:DUF459 domain-containing protein [Hyphomicrobiaceae bacterium]